MRRRYCTRSMRPKAHLSGTAVRRSRPSFMAGASPAAAVRYIWGLMTAHSMRSAFRLSISLLALPAFAQLPAGAGKVETEKLCAQCHEIERSISLRQDRAGWQATVD